MRSQHNVGHQFSATLVKEIRAWVLADRPQDVASGNPITAPRSCPSYPDSRLGTPFMTPANKELCGSPGESLDDQPTHPPSRTFGACVTKRCAYWSGRCTLGATIAKVSITQMTPRPDEDFGSNCPIRSTCRWLEENGPMVCNGCQLVEYNPW